MNTKICTSFEQSKKLIELGLDIETSDMYYIEDSSNNPYCELYASKLNEEARKHYNIYYIPAWSLSALLGLMPKLYEFKDDPEDGGCQPNLCKGWDNNQWHIVYRLSIYITEWYNDPIDAAFEMIVWLKENREL